MLDPKGQPIARVLLELRTSTTEAMMNKTKCEVRIPTEKADYKLELELPRKRP